MRNPQNHNLVMHFYEDTPSSCIWNGYFWEIFGHHSNTIIHGLDNKFDAYGSMINVRDGRKYSVQNYGDQVWMTDNLQTEKYHYHGEYYDDIDETGKNSKYGKLYSVDVISDAVPKGWHIPSIEEWRKLFSYLEKKDIIIKKGENYWKEPYRTGFAKWFINPSMAGGGYIQNSNSKNDFKFANLKKKAYYWSSSKANNGSSYIVSMSRKGIFIETAIDESKLSVRCIQDNPTILYQVKDSNNSKVVYKGDDSYSITLSNKNDFLQGVGIPEDKKGEMGDYYIDLKTGVYFEKNKKRWIVQNISFAVKNELIPYLIKCESLVTLVESGISVEELRKSGATLRDFLNYKKPNKITIKLLYDGGFTLREFKSVSKIYQYGISDEDLKEAGLLGTFKDERDNKKYKWVKIGNQVWMAENLKYIPKVDSMQIAMYQKKLAEYCKDEGYEYSEASKRYVKKNWYCSKVLILFRCPTTSRTKISLQIQRV